MKSLLTRLWAFLIGEKNGVEFKVDFPQFCLQPGEEENFKINIPIETIGQRCFVNIQLKDGRYIRKEIFPHPDVKLEIEINDSDEILVRELIKDEA